MKAAGTVSEALSGAPSSVPVVTLQQAFCEHPRRRAWGRRSPKHPRTDSSLRFGGGTYMVVIRELVL